ncbi:GNAT family N-acetyltransferase [Inconstantimicrobium mannanitabidum]|uniref:Uncharacterized protein n=1 Tax=Inconstantimicrobium mannanitabidum TaxID=1604901 RepID=A0ACB5R8E9_9CLOT|nr:GNAT family protein [Clostridium sp. TW13]GKX65312.1 hypothetical protein rsdtw13_05700 [Clostridium sp. TW13]
MNQLKKFIGHKCFLSPVDTSMTEVVAKWSNDIEMSIKTGDISDMITYETQKEYLEGMNSRSEYAFYIVDNSNEKVIGIARLMRISFINRNAVMGMFIGEKDNRNSGIGTEAGKLLLDFAFNVLNLRNVMVEVFSFNKASLKLCKKCGFKEIGRRRKAIIYGQHEYDEVFLDILNEEFSDSIIEGYLE